jgi:anhydro-N-acetylmuramic acid kinase
MNTSHEGYYIGLMTGTSMDAVDTVVVDIQPDRKTTLVASYEHPLASSLREKITDACVARKDSAHDIATLDQELSELYAECIGSLLQQAGIASEHIKAIGSHGQTIRHCPDCQPPYTVQIGNAARLAEMTGITVINDFRQRDMAAGGQGAPLAPLFHHHLFSLAGKTIVCINLGGIANISILHADGSITGFDTGPANTLMDQWIMHHQQQRYDKDAVWARSGKIQPLLLDALLSEPWLSRQPPKSTGPELFNLQWLEQYLGEQEISPADVQRSLCEFSAISLTNAVNQYAPDAASVVICGGGAYNPLLVERIKHHLGGIHMSDSKLTNIAPEWIEACLFGWLAYRTLNGLAGNVPAVTGARHEAVLGAIHPA